MVLLAAAVCNKAGKLLLSRQFVEMTRSRVEGLLTAFPKLMTTGGGSGSSGSSGAKQHTYVETESVRYVYQPLESLYILLITTKASNILEDLETLRLFARVVTEYCHTLSTSEVESRSFELILAFDEIVALGYRENVNLSQIKTFIEMDSHDERVYNAVRESQEKEAKMMMKQKAKELTRAHKEHERRGGRSMGGSGGGYGGAGMSSSSSTAPSAADQTSRARSTYTAPVRAGGGKALKLGGKSKDVDSFVTQLQSEGQVVADNKASIQNVASSAAVANVPAVNKENVHFTVEEKLVCVHGRGGVLSSFELSGVLSLRVATRDHASVSVAVDTSNSRGAQLQTHPCVDKRMWSTSSVVAPRNVDKPFPVGTDTGVVKWRLQSGSPDAAKDLVPLTLNIWADEGAGGCEVMIEYELLALDMELNNVVIRIPLPAGVGAPVIGDMDGDYQHNRSSNTLEWTFPVIDGDSASGSLSFTIPGHEDDFYPVNVDFVSRKSFCNIDVTGVTLPGSDRPVKYSTEVITHPERYEYV